jgi:hypothetical protein
MPTYSLGYREPAYVSIARKYKPQPKKRLSILASISGRRMKKLLRRHVFKSLNRVN